MDRELWFLVPGDLDARTGGYEYDRRIIAGLRARGWSVHVVGVEGNYPYPTVGQRAAAAAALASVPDHAVVLADGLAFGALPDEVRGEASRLRLVALVHLLLADETGLDADSADALRAGEHRALLAARGVVVTSRQAAEAVLACQVSVSRVQVVEPGTAPAAVATGSGGTAVQLLCVASVIPRKGHDTLVEALGGIASLSWRLTCVGSLDRDPRFVASLLQRIEFGGIGDRVTFAGEQQDAALESYYRQADLFVLATVHETYGMAVAEALARGIPVVSTPTGAIADLVSGDAGVLVPPADAAALGLVLRQLLTDRARLDRLRRGAMGMRSTLPTWEAATIHMEEALERLVC